MKNLKIFNVAFLIGSISVLAINTVQACNMYKITINGKTTVGCNEDAWRTTPRVWFETAKVFGDYGAAFIGSRFDGGNRFAPQSEMNEVGLSFSRLASYISQDKVYNKSNKKALLILPILLN